MEHISTLAKLLASDQLKIRRRAQIEAKNLLCQNFEDDNDLPSYLEILALCKGLHYSLWMQDKLLLKEEVVSRICEILPRISNDTILLRYINAIFETLAREWDRLDNWRVDKFMLLTRDFFNTGLANLPESSPEIWGAFLSAIFEKVLNTDVQHAIGLKMHMCTILGEELSKKKVKSFCVVSTLTQLVTRLKELPRHHSYAHTLLRLIYSLIRCLRRHANPSLDDLIDLTVQYHSKRGGHRKSFRRISDILSSIRNSKRKKLALATNSTAKEKHAKETESAIAMETDNQQTEIVKPKRKKLKRKKSFGDENTKKPKKLRLIDRNDEQKEEQVSGTALAEQILVSDQNVTDPVDVTEEPEKPKLENMQVLSSSPSPLLHAVDNSPDSSDKELSTGSIPVSLTNDETTPRPSPMNTSSSGQRRVSFGKVFRKKFKSTQRLSMTPTVKTTPSKGILREQTSTKSVKNRISL